MHLLRALWCSLFVSVVLAGPALAQDYSRTGVYVGVGGQLAIEDWGFGTGFGLNPGYGGQLLLGHRTLDWIAAEIEIDYTHFETNELFGTATIDFDLVSYTISAKAFPLEAIGPDSRQSGRLQPYLKAGLGGMHVDADLNVRGGGDDSNSGDGFALRFGGGLDAYVTQQFLLYLDLSYVVPFGDDLRHKSDSFSTFLVGIGLGYRF